MSVPTTQDISSHQNTMDEITTPKKDAVIEDVAIESVAAAQTTDAVTVNSLQEFLKMDPATLRKVSSLALEGLNFQRSLSDRRFAAGDEYQFVRPDDELKAFTEQLKYCTNLKKMALSKCGVNEAALTEIVDALPEQAKTDMELLSLANNQLRTTGKLTLGKQLEKLPNLRGLDLNNTQLSKLEIESLHAALPTMSNLKALLLNDNKLGERELISLANGLREVPGLIHLEVNGNRAQEKQLEEFRQKLAKSNPGLEIVAQAKVAKKDRSEATKEHRHHSNSLKSCINAAKRVMTHDKRRWPNTAESIELLSKTETNRELVDQVLAKVGQIVRTNVNSIENDLEMAAMINEHLRQINPELVKDKDTKEEISAAKPGVERAFSGIKHGFEGPLSETARVLDEVRQHDPEGVRKQFWIASALNDAIAGGDDDRRIASLARDYAKQDLESIKKGCMQKLYSKMQPKSAVSKDKVAQLIKESRPEEARKNSKLQLDAVHQYSAHNQMHPEQGDIEKHHDLRNLHSDKEMDRLAQEILDVRHPSRVNKRAEQELQMQQNKQAEPESALSEIPMSSKAQETSKDNSAKIQDRLLISGQKEAAAEQQQLEQQQALADKQNLKKGNGQGMSM